MRDGYGYKAAILCAGLVLAAGAARACDDPLNCPSKMKSMDGAAVKINGAEIRTWAKLNTAKQVREVGVTVPYALIENPPAPDPMEMPGMPAMSGMEGMGDSKAPAHPPMKVMCRIPFPEAVRKTAYFDHFELDWNPVGHEPKVFEVPHFDFHFYAVPKEQVDAIATFDPNPPAADLMPKGYIYPGEATFIPKMGVHAIDPIILEKKFDAVMIAGFDKGRMHFVEPMVTQEYLKAKKSFKLEMPQPKKLGRKTTFPREFAAEFIPEENAYRFVFRDFQPMS